MVKKLLLLEEVYIKNINKFIQQELEKNGNYYKVNCAENPLNNTIDGYV